MLLFIVFNSKPLTSNLFPQDVLKMCTSGFCFILQASDVMDFGNVMRFHIPAHMKEISNYIMLSLSPLIKLCLHIGFVI
jgi:hypothetical protein